MLPFMKTASACSAADCTDARHKLASMSVRMAFLIFPSTDVLEGKIVANIKVKRQKVKGKSDEPD
jgi:hypothetical protein